jgi:putative DNA primase/helicase
MLPFDLLYLNHMARFVVYTLVTPPSAPMSSDDFAEHLSKRKKLSAPKVTAVEYNSRVPIRECGTEHWMSFTGAANLAATVGAHVGFVYANFGFVPQEALDKITLPVELVIAASQGRLIMPVTPNSKRPELTRYIYGLNPATNDLLQIKRWFAMFPRCSWGVRTGQDAGFMGLDIDTLEGQQWLETKPTLPVTYTVKTGSPKDFKKHYYLALPPGMEVKGKASKLASGVDTRGYHNILVIPPSLHKSGGQYRVEVQAPIAPIPDWLVDELRSKGLVEDAVTPKKEKPAVSVNPSNLTVDQQRLGFNLFQKSVRKFDSLEPGELHDGLLRLGQQAGSYIGGGVLTHEEAYGMVAETSNGEDYLADNPSDFELTFNDGLAWGMVNIPWNPADTEDYFKQKDAEEATRVFTKLMAEPAGVSPLPPPPPMAMAPVAHAQGNVTLNPEERMLANLATQHAVALIFAKRMAGRMLYDRTSRKWLAYDGVRWSEDRLGRVHNFILNVASEMNSQNKAAMVSSSFCDGVNRHLQSFPEFACTTDQFDRDNYLLNTPAGTIDLRTGLNRPHSPADMLTKCALESPGADSEGTHFRKFLMEICGDDEELVRFHQVSLGAILSGAMEDHWMLFWTGVGRNGKNTLGELVQYVLGDYAKKIAASTLMSKKFQGHSEEIADLHGFRLAISSELNDGEHWDEARINEFTGDATLSARHMYGSRFQFARTHKHLVYANYKPQLRSVSDGIRSRIKIVPFKVSFVGREDKDLPGRLRGELSYVLQWLIDGHQQWLDAGKKLPKCLAVETETAEYFDNQSTPQLWLKERCEVREDLADLQLQTIMELYGDYKNWATSRGELPLSKKRWEGQAIQPSQKVDTRKGSCVRRLRLRLPEGFPFPLSNEGVPAPPRVVN